MNESNVNSYGLEYATKCVYVRICQIDVPWWKVILDGWRVDLQPTSHGFVAVFSDRGEFSFSVREFKNIYTGIHTHTQKAFYRQLSMFMIWKANSAYRIHTMAVFVCERITYLCWFIYLFLLVDFWCTSFSMSFGWNCHEQLTLARNYYDYFTLKIEFNENFSEKYIILAWVMRWIL